MKKGFTLMEVLAVILILAVIGGFAVPAFRSIRADIQARRARTAVQLLRDATLQMRAHTGVDLAYDNPDLDQESTSFNPSDPDATAILYAADCQEQTATGIPPARLAAAQAPLAISNLFACGYLNPKDFKGLPFEFSVFHYIEDEAWGFIARGQAGSGKYEEKTFACYTDDSCNPEWM